MDLKTRIQQIVTEIFKIYYSQEIVTRHAVILLGLRQFSTGRSDNSFFPPTGSETDNARATLYKQSDSNSDGSGMNVVRQVVTVDQGVSDVALATVNVPRRAA